MMLHSDEKLKVLLILACSQYMPIPLISHNCWDENKINANKYLYWP
jgi:hypothetical protein